MERELTSGAQSNSHIPLIEKASFKIRALMVGDRIEPNVRLKEPVLGSVPLTVHTEDGGIAVVFRYGAIVLFDITELAEKSLLAEIRPFVQNWRAEPESEALLVRVDAGSGEGIDDDIVSLHDTDLKRLQAVAVVISKSVVLADYESRLASGFDAIEPLAVDLQRHGRSRRSTKQLLQHIGGSLLSQHRMIGRVEVGDKPELLWERPDLDQLYARLEDELEIRERYAILQRKLNLISRTAETMLELVHARRSLRVEWYIVILIVVEIFLTLFDLFWLK